MAGFVPDSHAEAAGVRIGDVIESVDGAVIAGDNGEYWMKALHWQPGQQVRVKLIRDGTPLEFAVTLTGN
ncbi:MAG: PDZ domain-containing protein [Lacunisphaera sp.]